MGLGSKGAGSWEVPVTTLRSRKDGVVFITKFTRQVGVCLLRGKG